MGQHMDSYSTADFLYSFFRAARLDLADSKRAINSEHRETLLLLKDTAQRHMRTETSKSGKCIHQCRSKTTQGLS